MFDRREQMRQCAIKRQQKVSDWKKERDEVVLSLDVNRFREFYKKWGELGIYDEFQLPADDIIEITMRKMLVNMEDVPQDKYNDAKCWLFERGYDLEI